MSQQTTPAPTPEAELQAMEEKVRYWERYVSDQQQARVEAAASVQQLINESGLAGRGIDPADPAIAALAEDLEFRRQVSLHFGLKLDKAEPLDTSLPDPSRWRQRTRALKV